MPEAYAGRALRKSKINLRGRKRYAALRFEPPGILVLAYFGTIWPRISPPRFAAVWTLT